MVFDNGLNFENMEKCSKFRVKKILKGWKLELFIKLKKYLNFDEKLFYKAEKCVTPKPSLIILFCKLNSRIFFPEKFL